MHKCSDSQKGFSIVELLFIVGIIAILAAAGSYIYAKQKVTKPYTTVTAPAKQPIKTTTFTDKNNYYSFQLPENWTATYGNTQTPPDDNSSFLALKPDGFKAPGQENDWVATISVIKFPYVMFEGTNIANFDELKQTTLKADANNNPASRDTQINGTPVWRLEQTGTDSTNSKVATGGGYRDITYTYHKNKNVAINLDMRVYQHATTNYQGTKVNSSFNYEKYMPQFTEIANSLRVN